MMLQSADLSLRTFPRRFDESKAIKCSVRRTALVIVDEKSAFRQSPPTRKSIFEGYHQRRIENVKFSSDCFFIGCCRSVSFSFSLIDREKRPSKFSIAVTIEN